MSFFGRTSCSITCIWLLCGTIGICLAIPYNGKGHTDKKQTTDFAGSGDSPDLPQLNRDRTLNVTTTETSMQRTGEGQCSRTKIVGGHVSENHWPWQAELYVKKSGRHLCGGTLVGSEHVLTAAHCFDTYDKNEVMVRLGSRSRLLHESSVQTYPISCLHVHKNYAGRGNYDYDIALLKLKTAATEATQSRGVVLDEHVAMACLPRRREFGANAKCVVTGWGYTNFRNLLLGRLPSQLREARVPLISTKTCRDAYGYTLTNRMVCAGFMQGEKRADTCKGDSGGPLVCQSEDGQWKLWGVTSWGGNTFCNQSPTDPAPGVYMRVDKFVNWINKKKTTKRCTV